MQAERDSRCSLLLFAGFAVTYGFPPCPLNRDGCHTRNSEIREPRSCTGSSAGGRRHAVGRLTFDDRPAHFVELSWVDVPDSNRCLRQTLTGDAQTFLRSVG